MSRSALQLVGRNTGSSREALREALRNFCGPHALSKGVQRVKWSPKNGFSGSRALPAARSAADSFLTRASRPAALLLQLSGHNRARQRDKLAMLLDDLAVLQEVCFFWLFQQGLRVGSFRKRSALIQRALWPWGCPPGPILPPGRCTTP